MFGRAEVIVRLGMNVIHCPVSCSSQEGHSIIRVIVSQLLETFTFQIDFIRQWSELMCKATSYGVRSYVVIDCIEMLVNIFVALVNLWS